MGKLFTDEDKTEEVNLGRLTRGGSEVSWENLDLSFSEEPFLDYMELATEHLKDLNYKRDVSDSIRDSLKGTEIGSREYLYSLESSSKLIKGMAANLGTTIHVASLEDVTSAYTAKATHEVAMEGFTEFVKKIWEKIKSFFRSFFKSINDFIKRVTNSNQDLDKYEKYVKDYISKIKNKDLKAPSSTLTVHSRLPLLVSPSSELSPASSDIIYNAEVVTENLSEVIENIILHSVKTVSRDKLDNIEKIVKSIKDTEVNKNTFKGIYEQTVQIFVDLKNIADSVTTSEVSLGAIPYEVQNKLNSQIVTNSAPVHYRALYDTDNDSARLPRMFNIFTVGSSVESIFDGTNSTSNEGKVDLLRSITIAGITSTRAEEDNYITEIPIIDNLQNLEVMHDLYKDFSNSSKHVENIGKEVKNIDKAISNSINIISKEIEGKLGNLRDLSEGRYGVVIENGKQLLRAELILRSMGEVSEFNGLDTLTGIEGDGTLEGVYNDLLEASNMSDQNYEKIYKLLPDKLKEIYNEAYLKFPNRIEYISSEIEKALTPPGLSQEELLEISDLFNVLENLLRKTLTTYQQYLKTSCVDLLSIYTDTRYAMVKYIYDSARTYK